MFDNFGWNLRSFIIVLIVVACLRGLMKGLGFEIVEHIPLLDDLVNLIGEVVKSIVLFLTNKMSVM